VAAKRKRARDTEATREAILEAATTCFGRDGFAATGLTDVARAAGVTTGAIYHHFSGKSGLFKSVAEAVEADIVRRVAARPRTADPWADLLDSVDAALAICMAPHVRQIAFVDAPTVIGRGQWQEIQSRYGLGILISALEDVQAAGTVTLANVPLTARVLLAALIEAAEACASAATPEPVLADAKALLRRLLMSLRT
jgi:AcrR family transcriptional regulator